MEFKALGLPSHLLRAIAKQGFLNPTAIQSRAIPVVLAGKDLIGLAQTGTGKTAAFSLPLVTSVCRLKRTGKFRPTKLLIISPTRELALQIGEVIKYYSAVSNLKSTVIVGGVPIFRQYQSLKKGVDIVVGTPGRIEDHISQKTINLEKIEFVVLDEADQMLDIGFLPAIKRIFSKIPFRKQTLLFSATMSKEIRSLSDQYLKNPVEIIISGPAKPVEKIHQKVVMIEIDEKLSALKNLINSRDLSRILVFVKTKHGADKLVKKLNNDGIKADAIHGNKSQNQRLKALANFKKGHCSILIATDIAARGIDVFDVQLVVNYDLPDVPESYVHRIGRTARAGASGDAVSFCSKADIRSLKLIEKLINSTIEAYDKHGNKIRKRLSRKEYFKKTNARTKKKGTKASNKRVSKKKSKKLV